MSRFASKIAIVTGGGRGIGEAVTRRLIEEGATVVVATLQGTADALVDEFGDRVVLQSCDVSRDEEVDQLFECCRKRFGRLDLLLNNAGISSSGTRLHETSIEQWDRVMGVNLRGAYLVLRRSIAMMLESGGGAIVNMASIGGLKPSLNTTPYSITKAGLIMMTRAAALEYARDNIRVNCVCPGTILTPMLDGGGPDLIARKEALTPIGRIGTRDEVATLCCMLLSDDLPSVTGATYTIAGGREAQ